MITLDALQLPDEMIWIDEYSWSKVRISEKLSLSGVRNITENRLPSDSGRPITLTSDYAWIRKSYLDILFNWSEELNKEMVLILHNFATYNVRFRHIEYPVIEADQIVNTAFDDSNTYYNLVIKLEIA